MLTIVILKQYSIHRDYSLTIDLYFCHLSGDQKEVDSARGGPALRMLWYESMIQESCYVSLGALLAQKVFLHSAPCSCHYLTSVYINPDSYMATSDQSSALRFISELFLLQLLEVLSSCFAQRKKNLGTFIVSEGLKSSHPLCPSATTSGCIQASETVPTPNHT